MQNTYIQLVQYIIQVLKHECAFVLLIEWNRARSSIDFVALCAISELHRCSLNSLVFCLLIPKMSEENNIIIHNKKTINPDNQNDSTELSMDDSRTSHSLLFFFFGLILSKVNKHLDSNVNSIYNDYAE